MLGAELLWQLSSQGHELLSVYRSQEKLEFTRKQFVLKGENGESIFSGIHWQQCDLLDVMAVQEVLQGIDEVYHCAALVSFDSADDQTLITNNVQVTANIVDLANQAGVKKLVHVSSVAAVGRNADGSIITEKSQWTGKKGNSAYARSKYLAELEAWRAYEEGLPLVIVNPSIIIGAGDWQTGSSALFGKINGGFRFYSEGINAYVDVRDVASVMIGLMEAGITGERFLVMAENRSYREVFDLIADALGAKRPSVEAKPWMGAIVWRLEKLRSWITGKRPMVTRDTVQTSFQKNYYSNAKVKELLHYDFISVEESIRHFAEVFKRDHSS